MRRHLLISTIISTILNNFEVGGARIHAYRPEKTFALNTNRLAAWLISDLGFYNDAEIASPEADYARQVTTWLNGLRDSGQISATNKVLLQNALLLKELRYENVNDSISFLVVPLAETLQLVNSATLSPFNYLVLEVTQSGKISKGNIIQFVSPNKQRTALQQNQLATVFGHRSNSLTGDLVVLNSMTVSNTG